MRPQEATSREPDIVIYAAPHLDRYGEPADLVVEVISNDQAISHVLPGFTVAVGSLLRR
jgi:Uma2 family endonuclease